MTGPDHTEVGIAVEREGDIALVRLARPRVLNAFDRAMRHAFIARLGELGGDPGVRAAVLTGEGRAFSAGQDLRELAEIDAAKAGDWMRELGALYGAVRAFPKPLVVAVNGPAAGAGFQIALHADLRLGCLAARMAQSEIHIGVPSVLGPWIMKRVMGIGPTVEMSLTGRAVPAEECLRLGLLHRLVGAEELIPAALETARMLAARSPQALAQTKAWLAALAGQSFEETVEAAAGIAAEAFATGDPQRRIAAFLAERTKNGT